MGAAQYGLVMKIIHSLITFWFFFVTRLYEMWFGYILILAGFLLLFLAHVIRRDFRRYTWTATARPSADSTMT